MALGRIRLVALLGGALLLGSPAGAAAQRGALGALRNRVTGGKDAAAADGGMVRATAKLDWTLEVTSKEPVNRVVDRTPADNYGTTSTSVLTARGSVTGVLSLAPMALPDGPLAHNAAVGSGLYSLAFAQQTGSGELVSLAGGVRLDLQVTETGAPCSLKLAAHEGDDSGLSNPGTYAGSGERPLTAGNAQLNIGFRGADPVSINLNSDQSVPLAGKVTFSCRNRRPPGYDFGSFSVDHDFGIPAAYVAAVGFSTDAKDCAYKTSRAGSVLTLSGRCEMSEGDTRTVRTMTLAWDAPPPPAGSAAPSGPVPAFEAGKGSITFDQGGKEATWKLSTSMQSGAMGMVANVLTYTPDGAPVDGDHGVLVVTLMQIRGTTTLGALTIENGPAGRSEYDPDSSQCTTQVGGAIATGLRGDGTCTGGFDGPVVRRFSLTASK